MLLIKRFPNIKKSCKISRYNIFKIHVALRVLLSHGKSYNKLHKLESLIIIKSIYIYHL